MAGSQAAHVQRATDLRRRGVATAASGVMQAAQDTSVRRHLREVCVSGHCWGVEHLQTQPLLGGQQGRKKLPRILPSSHMCSHSRMQPAAALASATMPTWVGFGFKAFGSQATSQRSSCELGSALASAARRWRILSGVIKRKCPAAGSSNGFVPALAAKGLFRPCSKSSTAHGWG